MNFAQNGRLLRKLFCELPNQSDCPLTLKPGVAQDMLADELYQGVPTEDLVFYARDRFKNPKARRAELIPADRAIAIAFLRGAS